MTPRRSRGRGAGLSATVLAVVLPMVSLAVAACGDAAPPDVSLPADAATGRRVARDNGCAGCHGQNGEGAVGPAWVGLAGSTVTLKDGTTAVADPDYLRRAITDPQAQVTAGYAVKMPTNTLTDAQIDAIVAYIQSL